ncbi:sporulation integral membrane protein YtvI [Clostridia bacterium]|nr:sporulation integral membrane protein YtvI [Clostridia bacterium]
MKEFYQKNKAGINKAAFLISFVLFVHIFVNFLFVYVAPFFVGFIIALILNPIVTFLKERFKIHRGVSGIILILILIAAVVVIGVSLFNRLISQAISFSRDMPAYIQNIQRTLALLGEKIEVLGTLVPEDIRKEVETAVSGIISNLTTDITASLGSGVGHGGVSFVRALPSGILWFFFCVVSAFFFIKDMPLISETMAKITPAWLKKNVGAIRGGVLTAVGGYVKAQAIIMSVTGSICILGLSILKFPYALLVGMLIAILDALPFFGSAAVFWPWAIYNFLTGNYRFGIGLLIIYGAVFTSRQLLEPKVLSSQIGIHPILTLMSIFAGLKVFGIFGFVIGPFVVVCAKIILLTERENKAA